MGWTEQREINIHVNIYAGKKQIMILILMVHNSSRLMKTSGRSKWCKPLTFKVQDQFSNLSGLGMLLDGERRSIHCRVKARGGNTCLALALPILPSNSDPLGQTESSVTHRRIFLFPTNGGLLRVANFDWLVVGKL